MKSRVVTIRLPEDVYQTILRLSQASSKDDDPSNNHWTGKNNSEGGVSLYLRERLTYDFRRSHTKKKKETT